MELKELDHVLHTLVLRNKISKTKNPTFKRILKNHSLYERYIYIYRKFTIQLSACSCSSHRLWAHENGQGKVIGGLPPSVLKEKKK